MEFHQSNLAAFDDLQKIRAHLDAGSAGQKTEFRGSRRRFRHGLEIRRSRIRPHIISRRYLDDGDFPARIPIDPHDIVVLKDCLDRRHFKIDMVYADTAHSLNAFGQIYRRVVANADSQYSLLPAGGDR